LHVVTPGATHRVDQTIRTTLRPPLVDESSITESADTS
jgi:hypothetical protein